MLGTGGPKVTQDTLESCFPTSTAAPSPGCSPMLLFSLACPPLCLPNSGLQVWATIPDFPRALDCLSTAL